MHPSLSPPLLCLLNVLLVAPHVFPAAVHLLADAATGLPAAVPVPMNGAVRAVALGVKTLPEVIDGLKTWVMGILAAVATLFLVIGGLRYMTAAGDPAAVEQAKGSLKAALTGYALAVLAPVILQVLQGILGG
jgi:hypothetical protein